MQKIGRNDPCPSGAGGKFKKCLSAHPCLHHQSSPAEIWWVCDRWTTQAPTLPELSESMVAVSEICPAKFDAFLDLFFADPPTEIDAWCNLLMKCGFKRYPDLPGLFQRMSAHLSAAGEPELPWLYSSTATFLREDHPEMFSDVLAATLALDPAATPMESLEMLVGWADDLGRNDDCDRLRQRFPEFPEYMLEEEDDEESNAEDFGDPLKDPEPEFPPEINAALDKAWDDFNALDAPSQAQGKAFIEELLALPHEATSWNDVFDTVLKCGNADIFGTFHHLAAALAPTRNNNFAYVCWAAVEELDRLKTPERLPEIARTLLDFNPLTCDPDALSHIVDALLGHGFVNEMNALLSGFLPSLRENPDVMSWVVPRIAEEIFLLRLGALIASGNYSSQPLDLMIADLRAGLDDDMDKKSASVPLRYLMQEKERFSLEQFRLPSSTKDRSKQQLFWNNHQRAFVEIARDGWQTENRNPSRTLIGLYMILRSAENWINSPRKKDQKYPLNLLDYLNSAMMEQLTVMECRDFFGIRRERASVMCDASLSLIRWTARQGLLGETESAKAQNQMAQLMKKIGF